MFDALDGTNETRATAVRDVDDGQRRRKRATAERHLSDVEQHRGKKVRSNTDGDGPPTTFKPSWSKATSAPSAIAKRPPHGAFRPSWAKSLNTRKPEGIASPGNERRREPQHAKVERHHSGVGGEHMYARPAYGASIMRADQREAAEQLAQRLARDRTPGRIDAPIEVLREMATAVAEARADGLNPRTASKDALALREWECFAKLRGFDPNLKSEWTRRFPERESLKFSSYMLFRSQRMKGRAKTEKYAKPMSVYQDYLALRRVFKQRNVDIPSASNVREAMRGLVKRWVRRRGIESLRAKQVEPVTPNMVRKAVDRARQGGARVLKYVWELRNWTCFIVLAWMVVNLQMGSRKGESTKLPGDVDHNDWLTRRSLTWQVGKQVITDPDTTKLRKMLKVGTSFARIAPKGAKCDAFGTCHGTEPVILPYQDDDINPAAWLLEIEERWPCSGVERDTLPLFCDEQGDVFTDKAFAALIMGAMALGIGEARCRNLSPHSWRVWLATGLRKLKASTPLIMAFGRWLNPDSVKIYARLGVAEYSEWMNKLMKVSNVDSTRTSNLLDEDDLLAGWAAALPEREAADTDEVMAAAAAAEEPAHVHLRKGTLISVYWTEMSAWYDGTVTSSRVETGDDGQQQRATRVAYDAVGSWRAHACWHCLDDERWRPRTAGAPSPGDTHRGRTDADGRDSS